MTSWNRVKLYGHTAGSPRAASGRRTEPRPGRSAKSSDRPIGAVEHEKVRKIRSRHRQVGVRPLRPIPRRGARRRGRPGRSAAGSGRPGTRWPARTRQAGAVVQFTVEGPHTLRLAPGDGLGDQARIGPLNGLVEVRRDDQPLTAGPAAGRRFSRSTGSATFCPRGWRKLPVAAA